MLMIKLSKLGRPTSASSYSDTDEPGEQQVPVVPTTPVVINADTIRCFYARRDSQPGTRLTFTDGGGFAVSESPEEVERLIVRAMV